MVELNMKSEHNLYLTCEDSPQHATFLLSIQVTTTHNPYQPRVCQHPSAYIISFLHCDWSL